MDAFIRALVFAILFMLALLGFTFVLSMPASAHVLDQDECVAMAQDAGFLFEQKALGIPWERAKSLVERDIKRALESGESYVKDAEDVLRLLTLAEAIWTTDASKSDVQMSVWYSCIMKWQAGLI